ncbi:MAG: hypothetical protein Q9195_000034 [Heterodermia aff. obscurata]
MAPKIHLVRHAQGYHNLSTANHDMPDPSLTPLGESQCRHLAQLFPYHSDIDLLVASPIRRTLYTAIRAFPAELEKGMKVIALPEIQETSDLPCDTGSDVAILRDEFADKPVDLDLVVKGWDSKAGKWAATSTAIENRAREARVWLRGRAEENIAVVTHGGFLHFLTEDWTDSRRFEGTGWANCEYRSYRFSDDALDTNASMIETAESRARRRGTEKPLTKTERIELKETAIKTWTNAGYQQAEGKV